MVLLATACVGVGFSVAAVFPDPVLLWCPTAVAAVTTILAAPPTRSG